MMRYIVAFMLVLLSVYAQNVVDIPTRSGVKERVLVLSPQNPKAVVILFAGGHGGLQISDDGKFGWGEGNFLVRTRELFAKEGLMVVIVDAPSDRQREPYLNGYRQTAEHLEDIRSTIAWVKTQTKAPIWLVGTSRGTQSVAYFATEEKASIKGIVLTSTILTDPKSKAVPKMALENITIPTLVVHHENDGCSHCSFSDMPSLMNGLTKSQTKELMVFSGGQTKGDPCNAFGYHGFNGIEQDVVSKIARWIVQH